MKLKTKRLILRDLTNNDKKCLVKHLNNLNISRWLALVPYPYTLDDANWFIGHCSSKAKEKPRLNYSFGIELKEKSGIIGMMGLEDVDRKTKTAEIGYWISEDYWRKGYVSEASKKIINYGFNKLQLKKIKIPVFADNQASNGLAKYLGAKFYRTKLKAATCKATGKVHDENIYWLKKEDWKY